MTLLIDNYDSFTYNVYQYIGKFDDDIKVVRNDKITIEEIVKLNPDRIVISPGPKTPDEAGICIEVINKLSGKFDILGICLGHQSIGQAFGGIITHAPKLFHGKQSKVTYNESFELLKGLSNPFLAARYHSLVIDPKTIPESLEVMATTQQGDVMAVKHKKFNVYGLQFHPESIYTPDGMKIIENFIKR
jgi:anthranilate synthase component II